MTRETKIGLLVGLAFIIVIGILLSDHMTSTTQPPQAALAETAPNVRDSVTSPAPTSPAPAQVGHVPPITPANPVLTQIELHPPTVPQAHGPTPVSQVVIGGPAVVPQQPQTPIAIRNPEEPAIVPQNPQPKQTGDSNTGIEQWAQGGPSGPKAPMPPPTPVAKREIVAVAGDNLSKITARMLGTSTKANRDAVIKANPTLQKNPDLIVEGRKYTIPQAVATAQTPASTPAILPAAGGTGIPETVAVDDHKPAAHKPVPVTELVDSLPASTPAPAGGSFYVVKENDNLWKIASEQLGSGNAWQQIRDMNKDVLKGGDTVQPNMRLKLPAKSLASAN